MARYQRAQREASMNEARQRLLAAAVQEIFEKGYAGANINQISLAAGFARGTVYNYFPSKQALMLALIAELGAAHNAYIAERVLQAEGPERRLAVFFEAGFGFIEANPVAAQVLITTLYGPDPALKEAMAQAYLPMFGLVAEQILAPGMRAGVFRPDPPAQVVSILMTIYLGTGSQVDEQGKVRLDPQAVADFALRALRA